VTLNATQLADTVVPLAVTASGVVGLPSSVAVPAGSVSAPVSVSALTLGSAVLTAGPLNDTTKQATVHVLPPPPTLVSVTPSPATLLVGASTALTLTLNAAQATDTVVAIAAAPMGVLTVPATITVPAGAVAVPVPITGVLPGTATLTAGPLNGSTVEVPVTVNQLPPTVTALTPPSLTLPKGTAESLSVTITPVQADPTAVPLTSSDPSTVEVPASVPVPAGSAEATFPVIGRNVGPATVTAGPLNGTTAGAAVTVIPPALVTLTIAPAAVTLAVGQTQAFTVTGTYTDGTTQDLTGTGAWTSSDETVATITTPGGVGTARAVGQTTIAVTADGKTTTATVTVTPPTLTVLALAPTLPIRGVGQTVQFQATGTYTDGTTQDLTGGVTWTSSDPAVATITSPGGLATLLRAGQATIKATHVAGMTVDTTLTVTGPHLTGLTLIPPNPTKTIGRSIQFTATGTYSDGSTQNLTAAVTWTSGDVSVATITSPGGLATALAAGTTTITATHPSGPAASTTLTATLLPPDPVAVAPSVSATVATPLGPATEFLYAGPDPVQVSVTPGVIDAQRASVLRGRVLTRDGTPLSGVTLSILNHPEYGTTLSRADGMFDLAVNGGGQLTVQYQRGGYLPVQRPVTPTWQDYAWLSDVVLIPYDTRVTTVDLTAPTAIQVARGNPVTDSDGTRQATLFFKQGTTATIPLPGGGTQALTTLNVRATEYTVGATGPKAMPGPLPPTTGYTYAVELSVDEAVTQGVKLNGKDVLLSQPVVFYVENFLNFPVGGIVPVGYYDTTNAAWVPSDNGRIVKILSLSGGLANLDLTGSGTPANAAALAALGISEVERQTLAALYAVGQSLWRIALPHLSTWDANWGMGCQVVPGNVACQGPTNPIRLAKDVSCPTPQPGSIIACQNQTLGEALELAATPFRLHYESGRTPGRLAASTVTIPVSGATLPAGVQGIELEIGVAGRVFTQQFPALPNQTVSFIWDGLDAYGRRPHGAQPVTIRVGYTYPAVYQTPAQLTRSFGYNGGGFITGSRARQTMTFWQVAFDTLGPWDARAQGLGGWTLDVHHAYDPLGRVLYEGTGRRRAAHDVGWVMTTIAGTGTAGYGGDGGPATQAQLNGPNAVAVDAQGNVLVVDQSSNRVRRISPDGLITTLAGTGVAGFSGDGGPATQAQLNFTSHGGGVAVDGQGAVYIADRGNERIRKVGADGVINTVAGTGVAGFSGDGGPLASAQFNAPFDVVVGRGGSLIITDWGNLRIRQVSPDGIVTTVAGTGVAGFSGDGGPATQAQLNYPTYTAVDAQGNLFIVDQNNHRIRRVSPGGVITTVAGTGTPGFSGDGGPATNAMLHYPATVVVDRDGSLFIVDEYNYRVRRVDPNGIITTVAGTGTPGFSGDGGPATAAATGILYHIAVDGRGALVLGDYANQRVRRVAPALPTYTAGEIAIASDDGQALYVFDPAGRHLRTHDMLTGAERYRFRYDGDGYLTAVTDGDGNVTHIERNGATPTAIVSADGQRTTLTVDGHGYLATLTNPAGETTQLTSSADGLLQTYSTPRNHAYRFGYDSLGRLTRDEDPATGFKTLDRTGTANTYTVTLTTALNRTSTYRVEPLATGGTRQRDTEPDGTQTEIRTGADAVRTTTAANGTVTSLTEGPDPRFGMQAPIPKALTLRMPSGLTSSWAMTRAVTLGDPNNLLSLTSQTDTMTVNGRTSMSTYAASTKTRTNRSQANRVVTTSLDAQGRVVREQVDSLEPVAFMYDPRGRLSTVTHGTGGTARTSTFTYNTEGLLETITDSLSRAVHFTYDPAGRRLTQTLPDGRVIQTIYDANGNIASITPPSRPAHTFDYTPIDLEASYTPPDLGIGNVATTYTYNPDRQLTQVTRPDGQTLTLEYEPTGGRLSTLTASTGQTTLTYQPATGNLARITSPGGVGLAYAYDGALLTGTTWTGPVAGSVTRTSDSDFRVAVESVNGADTIAFAYDPDSLLTQAGNLTLSRHPQHGLLTGTALGSVTDNYAYNTFGELGTYEASVSGSPMWRVDYTRDALGRIMQKVETISGATRPTVYGYDLPGRLTDVTVDGTLAAHYDYDGNGNRLGVTRPLSGTVSGTYDAQDRLTSYGAVTYTYTAHGDLRTATSGGETTSYTYDVFGNLTAVTLPNGTSIEYVLDGQNRRIGKKVNGILTQGFLYSSQLRPAAELDGSGGVVARFVYGTRINVPDYMIKGGVTYRLLTDPLGSVRLVVGTATGTIAQRIDYDEFGQITEDTNPGFQPFGFAGGLYDPDTKLTRFGARDYDAFTGRWTTKDPIGFSGRDANLYGYALNNPANWFDPIGQRLWIYAQANVGGGAGVIGGEVGTYYLVDPYTGDAHQWGYVGVGPGLGFGGAMQAQGGLFEGPENPQEISNWALEVSGFAAAGKGGSFSYSGTSVWGRGESAIAVGPAAGAGWGISGMVTRSWYWGKTDLLPRSIRDVVQGIRSRLGCK